MRKGERFGRLVGAVTRRPLLTLGVTALLALGGAALALRLEPSAATDTLVDRGSDSFKATERFKQDFGDEAVVVLVRGDLSKTVLTDDLGRVLRLEGCLSGNVPDTKKGLKALPPVCSQIADLKPAKVVFGPATFINTAVNRIVDEFGTRQAAAQNQAGKAASAARALSQRRGDSPAEQERLARAAAQAVNSQFTQYVIELGLRYGITAIPRIDDPNFVSALVFDRNAGAAGVPKSRFAYLFPSPNAAMITIRLKPDLSNSQRRRAIDLFRTATEQRVFKPRHGAHYIVSGVPVVSEGLADAVQSSIFVLLGAALLVMAATLALVFRSRLRLLPLALALAAAALTFGALSLAGGSLTMASIAVLPVLIGLAVDYSIQFQARFDEQRVARGRSSSGGRGRGRRRRSDDPHGGGRHRGRLPGAAAVAGSDGARLRRAAGGGDRAGAGLRDLRRLRGAGALRAPRARSPGAATRPRAPGIGRGSSARGGRARVARHARLAGPGRAALAAAPRARDRADPGRGGAGGGHAERGDLGRA